MLVTIGTFLSLIGACFRPRADLVLENLALRQQLLAMSRRRPKPGTTPRDRIFWVILRQLWSGWKQALIIVEPESVVRWHRRGFKLFWSWVSRKHVNGGRKPTGRELRELIFRLVAENPNWGAPRIHGELQMLGFDMSERTVVRWMRKAPRHPEPAKRWSTFLSNHREAIAAMDFFTLPTLTFDVLYRFIVIAHNRCRIVQLNVTRHPTSSWVIQQLREALAVYIIDTVSLLELPERQLPKLPAYSLSRKVGSQPKHASTAQSCVQSQHPRLPNFALAPAFPPTHPIPTVKSWRVLRPILFWRGQGKVR